MSEKKEEQVDTIPTPAFHKVGIKEFKPFIRKEFNLRKINLRWDSNDGNEGIWAWLSDDDIKKYEDDTTTDRYTLVALANDSLIGIPWGAIVPIKWNGSTRPYCVVQDMIDTAMKDAKIIFHPECLVEIEKAKSKKKS